MKTVQTFFGKTQSPSTANAWGRSRGQRLVLPAAVLAVLAIAILSIGVGSVAVPPLTTVKILAARLPFMNITADWPVSLAAILFDIRLPRVALMALTGAALASSGTAYQAVFRNPLADPYLIGVASGAGLGAICAILLRTRAPQLVGAWGVPLGAFAGALLTVALVYALGRVGRSMPTTTLLLAGVALGALASALTTFLLLRAGRQLGLIAAFLLGGYGSAGWEPVLIVTPLVALGFGVLLILARPLNLLLFDEEQAQQLGVDVERVKLLAIVAATLTTAAPIAFSGLIGFVGLIVPHAARILVGADHRRLLPLAALGGAGFLMLADLLARTLVAPEELPLGVVTAFAGVPFFLYLLRRAKNAAFF
jgi:iron complex transport system permease protein